MTPKNAGLRPIFIASAYPPPYAQDNTRRFNRRLGDFVGLTKYGVALTRIVPGGQSSHRHAHSAQDEFVWVLEGEVVLNTDAGKQTLSAGMCAAFPASSGDTHQFLNRNDKDVLLLVVGDRSDGDVVTYPDVDMHLIRNEGMFHKDGRKYE